MRERMIDLERYQKYREKGRLSPRNSSSFETQATNSLSSQSTNVFNHGSKFCGAVVDRRDLKYPPPQSTTPLSKYIFCNPSPSKQPEEMKLRKLQKWERFRNSQKSYNKMAEEAVQNLPYPKEPSLAVSAQVETKKQVGVDPPLVISVGSQRRMIPTKEDPPDHIIANDIIKRQPQHPRGCHHIEGTYQKPFNLDRHNNTFDGSSQNPIIVTSMQEEQEEDYFPEQFTPRKTPAVRFDFTPKQQQHSFDFASPRIVQPSINSSDKESTSSSASTYKTPPQPETFTPSKTPPKRTPETLYRTIPRTMRPRFTSTPPHLLQHYSYLQKTQSSSSSSSSRRRDRIQQSRDELEEEYDRNHDTDERHLPFLHPSAFTPDHREAPPKNPPRSTFNGNNLDQRTVRLLFHQEFASLIRKQKLKEALLPPPTSTKKKWKTKEGVSVICKPRSILQDDEEQGDFNILGFDNNNLKVYETFQQQQEKHVTSHSFPLPKQIIFHDELVYDTVASPLVHHIVEKGGDSAIIICGSHKSGKTYSLQQLQQELSRRLFDFTESVDVQFIELNGNHCFDLLSPGSFVQVNHQSRLEGAKMIPATSLRELQTVWRSARRRLAARAQVRHKHQQHSSNSLSFQLCQLSMETGGCLTLLECPFISKEDTSIASSQWQTLLQCISGKFCDDDNDLIKLLSPSFMGRVSVVLCLSPNATDTEETLSMLNQVQSVTTTTHNEYSNNARARRRPEETRRRPEFVPQQAASYDIGTTKKVRNTEQELVLPRQWNHEELITWLTKKHLLSSKKKIPNQMTGRLAMRMSKAQLFQAFFTKKENPELANQLYNMLRVENDRMARLRVKKRMTLQLNESYNTF